MGLEFRKVMLSAEKVSIVAALQTQILRLQGFKHANNIALDAGLGPIKDSFPNASFPLGAVHEFLSPAPEEVAATTGFISGVLSSLVKSHGTILWISSSQTIFPPALKTFGIQPDHVIFIHTNKEKDIIWAMEEALKCSALTGVVGEMKEISFTASRRLQLAVEQSQVTGFIIRNNYRTLNTTACVSRWRISSLSSEPIDDLPGIGFPKWKVELLRMRNGKPGVWDIQWINGKFVPVEEQVHYINTHYPSLIMEGNAG